MELRVRAFWAACSCALAVSGCGSDATSPTEGRPTLEIESINGAAVASTDTARAVDSLAVAVAVTNPDGAPPITALRLLARFPDGTMEAIEEEGVSIAAGQDLRTVLHSYAAPSGTYALQVTTQAGDPEGSELVPVELTRPATWLRLLSINGEQVNAAGVNAVEDSFRVTVAMVVGDSAAPVFRATLQQNAATYPEMTGLGVWIDSVPAGTTRQTTFTAYIAPAGEYEVVPEVFTYSSDPFDDDRHVFGDPIAVAVSQSDQTPPTLSDILPEDGAIVSGDPVELSFLATDPGGVWRTGYMVIGRCGSSSSAASAGPHQPQRSLNTEVCSLAEGENRIELIAEDVAWNQVSDTITVHYEPN